MCSTTLPSDQDRMIWRCQSFSLFKFKDSIVIKSSNEIKDSIVKK